MKTEKTDDDEQHPLLQDVTRAHIDSFNYFVKTGVNSVVKHMDPIEFNLSEDAKSGNHKLRISLNIAKIEIFPPRISHANKFAKNNQVYPTECREKRSNYMGDIQVMVSYTTSDGKSGLVEKLAGQIPIMVKSDVCHLAKLKKSQLISHGEEPEEMGGYFIIGGNEKVIRLLIQQRRNYPICLKRGSWKNRGPEYTEYGVSIRCVQEDQTSNTLTLHYLNGGTAKLGFGLNKEMFFVPIVLVLKGLLDVSDKYIFDELVRGKENDSFYKGCVISMLRLVLGEGVHSQASVLAFIGKRFRVKLGLSDWHTDEECGRYLFKRSIAIHLDKDSDKFNLMVYMTRKLFAYVGGECCAESPDNPMFQEVLLPGHLLQMVLKEKLEGMLLMTKRLVQEKYKKKPGTFSIPGDLRSIITSTPQITKPLEYLLSTGNLISKSGLGLMQARGFSVIADKLNFYRYISHFRAVHRGSFFTEMRTTSVRKLLPEAWGFLCPVHTPDGTPCGLLNHLSISCKITNSAPPPGRLLSVLTALGVSPIGLPGSALSGDHCTVLLDGRVCGGVAWQEAAALARALRTLKVKGRGEVPSNLEIALIPPGNGVASQYPGLYLFSSLARMVRPVLSLAYGQVEMVGSFEQVYLDVAVCAKEATPGITTHQELNEQNMLSIIANMTPFSDFNQSPRNMYQCQMGKQTMGTPLHAYPKRADNKLYRIQTPQTPIVKPRAYDQWGLDEYPLGTNTVVAVISYTGYDMEDAMILNKSSYERGFAHGSIIKAEVVNLNEKSTDYGKNAFIFGCNPTEATGFIDQDGLPHVGAKLFQGDPFYSYINLHTGQQKVEKYMGTETATVEQVKVLGEDTGTQPLTHVCFVLRVARNPTIGDKFSSRHGQKGICSMLWPATDMPFTESGMVPDIIFNPHGFPSRMTIGMMIESMAGKAGALHGLSLDATPFTFSEDQSAIHHFGQMLTAGGYNYFGTERMYSGATGREMEADIYFGIVYYQRLRHMVSDKFQVRTTGPVDQVTQQPIKGRKRAGGIRFGEMERDALISHGTSFLLQDRLFNCSDKSKAWLCRRCQTILSPLLVNRADVGSSLATFTQQLVCQHCQTRDQIHPVSVPYVFRYLTAELASIGVKINLDVKPEIAA